MLSKTLTEPLLWVLLIGTVAVTIVVKDWADRVTHRGTTEERVERDQVEEHLRQLAQFGAGLGVTTEEVDRTVTEVWTEGGRSTEEMLVEIRRRLVEMDPQC